MKKVIIIPARYGSTRLGGKPLIKILGKPVIEHVYQRCRKCENIDEIYVATDDERIENFYKPRTFDEIQNGLFKLDSVAHDPTNSHQVYCEFFIS